MGPHGVFWWIGAGVLIVAELMTGTFYLLMIALGFLAGVAAYGLGAPLDLQLMCAALVALIAVIVLRRSRFGRRRRMVDASTDPGVNLDIGSTLTVAAWHEGRARTMYRGAEWDVELAPGEPDNAHLYEIQAVRGNCLIVGAHREAGAARHA
ncbi:Putative activity regulator of membrane protease YbbK [Paraburkholderia tropica]|uniref:NfeD family protein n=1 Tax=Paraburkholderia TaxID=1822464 RepID=UPI001CB44A8E|nr:MULTISPECIES: NfeD family protein [Paraburkholderia]CAG9197366.1 Putative activity regulator of membrane protease YbbK [Paraburkholderia tropica]